MTRQPGIWSIASAVLREAAIVLLRSASPCSTSCRRAPSSDSISSDEGDVERISRNVRATASRLIRPESLTCSSADCVSEPAILCTEVSIASAPMCSAFGGRSRWKPKCGPHDWSTTSGTPAACATSTQPATSAASRSRWGRR
jgi:hypothetical protein